MIDLLLGGSPCQGFSFAGKQLNFFDPRSKLFFDYVKALEILKPKYFLLENVKMKKEYEDVITQHLGVKPIEINSALVSAQNRVRLYWTNIPNVTQPKDKGINLVDILESDVEINPGAIRGQKLNKATIIGRRLNDQGKREDYNKDIPITQCLEVRATNTNKSNCLTTVDKDNVLTPLPVGRYPDAFKNKLPFRYYTVTEYCRLQTLPDNYCDCIPESQAKKCLGNSWTVDVIAHILSFIPEINLNIVVSLFDGISCGQVALERAGKVYNQYYASEIDKYAIAVTQKNYPHTMQLGDVTKVDWNTFLDRLDLI
ncbi:DNA cytosine methyltransferase [Acetivibrio straminisolvens]|jgi:DNA (cytosine-5)-methyltransferase 3A|uniref:DNA cytosine methyltransferase n=1 Tax=Acetivibrio straminisolvens TaxID=253314 RepID=UPI00223F8155|nr:DNA cytosine methyltransferase [Acetivibrio straminisolvens]